MTPLLSTRCRLKEIFQKVIPLFSLPNFSTDSISQSFRTSKSDPRNHTLQDEGLYYSIDNSISLNVLFEKNKGLPLEFSEECKTFEETAIMVRKPALEIINCLNNTNYEEAINRYVLYGKYGSGVTTTLAHIIHYAFINNWLIVHVPRVLDFGCTETEVCESPTRPGLLDLPLIGSEWLTHFKTQNHQVINKFNLKLQKTHKWNIEEENQAGESLLSLVDHGIARGKYSCEVIIALLDEIKELSKNNKVKTLVAIDEYSSIFNEAIKPPRRKIKYYAPRKISCIQAFRDIVLPDWHNGAAVLTCRAELGAPYSNHYPFEQLKTEGFEILDPFVPIEVPDLTEKEFANMLAFYKSQNWLRRSDGDQEIAFLSGSNPLFIREICGPL